MVGILDRLAGTNDVPETIAVDNWPEVISWALAAQAYRSGVRIEFSRPGKPTDNASIEWLNGHFRAECLTQHWLSSPEEARTTVEAWRIEYDTERPHRALGQQTPAAFRAGQEASKNGGS